MKKTVEPADPLPTIEIKGVKLTPKDIKRFMSKIDKNGPISPYCPDKGPCWLWMAGCFVSGYGQFSFFGDGNKKVNARTHRISYGIHGGKLTTEKPYCLHWCHNNKCCNPDHLRAGTPQDNMDDKVAAGRETRGEAMSRAIKGKTPRGERAYKSKLRDSQVLEIRTAYDSGGMTRMELSEKYGVSWSAVDCVVRRLTWTHI